MRYDIWFSDGGQAGIVSSGRLAHPVRAVLYGTRPDQEGLFLSLKLDDRSIVPLNVPLSDRAEATLRTCDWVFFGTLQSGVVTESLHVPLVPACSDTHWSGLDGAMLRPRRAVSSFMSFLGWRSFGEPLHVPDGLEETPSVCGAGGTQPGLAPALAFWSASSRERGPINLGRAWRRRRSAPPVKPLSDVWTRQVS